MPAVTQLLPDFLGGVSRQPDNRKLANQVREATNAYPDPTFGMQKRPGFQFLSNLGDATTFDHGKWFIILKDNREAYLGCITKATYFNGLVSTTGSIYIWNAVTQQPATVTYLNNSQDYLTGDKPQDYHVLTIQDSSVITNKRVATGTLPGGTLPYPANSKATIRLKAVEYSANYKTTINGVSAIYQTRNADQFVATSTNTKLNADEVLQGIKDSIEKGSLHVEDATITANPAKANGDYTAVAITGGGSVDLTVANGDITNIKINTFDAAWTVGQVLTFTDAELAGATLKVDSLPQTGLTITQLDTSLEISSPTAFTIDAVGGQDNEAVEYYQDTVTDITKLVPDSGMQGRIVEITNSVNSEDNFWYEFNADDGVSGKGYWEEVRSPAASPGLDPVTMPVKLFNTGGDNFTLDVFDWKERDAGDEETNPDPGFVGYPIQQSFYSNNRLGFLSEARVVMSVSDEFTNFFATSALTSIDSDPIDIDCSSIRPALLFAVLPVPQGLVLFSRSQQFLLFSDQGLLKPSTVNIRTISNYEMDTDIDPQDLGTYFVFISKTSNYTRVFAMQTNGEDDQPNVAELSKVVSDWIPRNKDMLTCDPQNDLIILSSILSNEIHMFRKYNDGERDLMQTWFKWKAPGWPQVMQVVDNNLFIVFNENGKTFSAIANLNSAPDGQLVVNSNGIWGNPAIDLQTKPTVSYNPVTDQSIVQLPYDHIPGLTPVVMVTKAADQSDVPDGFNLPSVSRTLLDVGNITNANRPISISYRSSSFPDYPAGWFSTDITVGVGIGGATFNVPSVDLTTLPTGYSVIAGYLFDYEIVLPEFHYKVDQEKKISDYRSYLNISRLKFSLGLTGVCDFYVKARGIADWTYTHAVTDANYYRANDGPLADKQIITVPIHQRSSNFLIKVTSNYPLPVSLDSCIWEGQYSQRYYQRS